MNGVGWILLGILFIARGMQDVRETADDPLEDAFQEGVRAGMEAEAKKKQPKRKS
jgi:hypothetical protein